MNSEQTNRDEDDSGSSDEIATIKQKLSPADDRKRLRLWTAAFSIVFSIIAILLLCSFLAFGNISVTVKSTLEGVIYSFFGIITLALGFIAGTNTTD